MTDKKHIEGLSNQLVEFARASNTELSPVVTKKLIEYLLLVDEANKTFNLTTIPPEKGVILHLLDSIVPLGFVKIPENSTVLDVGSGAGFPAVPIAITREDLIVTALDDTLKKINFISGAVSKLNVLNVTAVHGRAEELGKSELYRGKFGTVVARAVADLGVLIELCAPFLQLNGRFLAFKGPDATTEGYEEIRALCGLELLNLHSFELPNGEGQRLVFEFKKTGETPQRFPRSMKKILKQNQSAKC